MAATEPQGFMLFACCRAVKGAARSIVCDIQRSDYVFISNELYLMLSNGGFLSQPQLEEIAKRSNGKELQNQLNTLEEREFGFRCSEKESRLFPQMEIEWKTPKKITNAIIDSDKDSCHPFPYIFSRLAKLGCQAVQLRFFDHTDVQTIEDALKLAQQNQFTDVEMIVADMDASNTVVGRSLARKYPILTKIIFYSARSNQLLSDERHGIPIYQITNRITSADHCGFIHPDGFVIGMEMFAEAQKYNTCLHGKISFDTRGNIKNCPSMTNSFGKVGDVDLDGVLENEDFKRLWKMGKDQVSICKDCEFRYICTDCRAYLTDDTNLYSKPAKCSYDTYTATWKR